jgi:hypothetical protein
VIYEWDPKKAAANLKKHKASFDEATSVFTDPSALTFDDPDHSLDEERRLKLMGIKNLANSVTDDLRPEYDLTSLKGRVRGKYYARATAGTTMVLLEPDVAEAFADGASVNRALRFYLTSRGKLPPKAPQPTSRARKKAKSKRSARAARG